MTDFLTGIALRTRHRSTAVMATVPAVAVQQASVAESEDAVAEPRFERASAPVATASGRAVPAAASIAESVLMDHPEPKIAQPVMPAREPNDDIKSDFTSESEAKAEPKVAKAEARIEPKIPSPELQPGGGAQEQ
jgi:hypothetical protein